MTKGNRIVTVTEVTVSHNQEHNGIEIRFPEKPADKVREKMLEWGFKFAHKLDGKWWADPRWYAKHTPEMNAKAQAMAKVLNASAKMTVTAAPSPVITKVALPTVGAMVPTGKTCDMQVAM